MFKKGDWVFFQSTTAKSFGYVLQDEKPEKKLKVHMIKKDLNTHMAVPPGHRFVFPENVTPANKVPDGYADKVEEIIKPLLIDHCLKTRNKEAFERYLKGDAI